MKKKATLEFISSLVLTGLSLGACSSGSKSSETLPLEPQWAHQPARTVDGGYIIYVATSEARTLEQAHSRAEAAALQNISNECSFAPKGTRLEDLFADTVGVLHRAYAKVAVSFEECEAAQNAVDPAKIRTLANIAMTEQIRHHQELIDQDERRAELEAPSQKHADSGLNPALASTSTSWDSVHFFVVRQQIAYAKEVVILAPSGTYLPNSPQSVQFRRILIPVLSQVRTYQVQNPQVRTMQTGWSSLASKPSVPRLTDNRGHALKGMHPGQGIHPPLMQPLRQSAVQQAQTKGTHPRRKKKRRPFD